MKVNIKSIFVILLAFGKIDTTNIAKIQKQHLAIDDHLNSEKEKSLENNFDEKKTPKSKLTSAAKDLRNPPCPDKEVISPCSCSIQTFNEGVVRDKGVVLDCSSVTSDQELQTIFAEPFPQNDMYKFVMDQWNINSSIDKLPLGIFGSKTFRNVKLKDINFNFSFNSFDHMNATLHSFYVNSAPIYKINYNFNAYAVLNYFSLGYCPLTDFLISSPTLEVFRLHHTNITERADNSPYLFGPMPNLRELAMTYGNLHKMPDTSGYPKLAHIYIYKNHISSIDVSLRTKNYLDTFSAGYNDFQDIPVDSIRMSENSTFYLFSNQIQYLEEEKWKNILLNASLIWLQDNPLDCSCVIAWLFRNDTMGIEKLKHGSERCDDGVLFADLDPGAYEIC